MTYKENVRAILESNFSQAKDELIDIAVERICEQKLMNVRVIPIPDNITRKELHKAIFGTNPPELDSPYCSCARNGGCDTCKYKGDINCDVNWWNAPFDRYMWISESETTDLGDYPDTVPNQFDNLTGSMNV